MHDSEHTMDYTLHYETWHTMSDEHKRYMSAFYQDSFAADLAAIGKDLAIKPENLKILDFGCGMGLFLNYLNQSGCRHIRGYEIDRGQAHAARKMGLHVEHNDDPLAWLKNCNETFEVIFAIDVLEHVPPEHLGQTLAAMRALLKPNGKLVATVPNANATMAGRWRYIDWTHRVSFTEHSLSHIVRLSGFSVESVVPSEIVRFYKKPQGMLRRVSEKMILRWVRFWRRLEVIGEFGWDEGLEIPLATNIKIIAGKEQN
ncbi:MAG: hypothetical protein RL189_1183 [Pseudomonadota bacterium]